MSGYRWETRNEEFRINCPRCGARGDVEWVHIGTSGDWDRYLPGKATCPTAGCSQNYSDAAWHPPAEPDLDQRCGDRVPTLVGVTETYHCQAPAGHSGDHRQGDTWWGPVDHSGGQQFERGDRPMTGHSERRDAAPIRVHTDNGSHIEPPLDPSWDDLTKLRWKADVVGADTGLQVDVHNAAMATKTLLGWRDRPGYYSVNVGMTSAAAFTFRDAWTYLNGVSTGAEQIRRLTNSGGTA